LFTIKPDDWQKELEAQQKFFDSLGKDMPRALIAQHDRVAEKFAK